MAIGINTSSGSGTGYSTNNPQITEQNLVSTGLQNPQAASNASSINNQSSGVQIPLQPASITTSSLQPTNTNNHIPVVAFIPIIAVVVAVILCLYIYASSKIKNMPAH